MAKTATTAFSESRLSLTIRFDQGYRYLDKCGETMIRLEDSLPEGWLPGPIDPNGALIQNFAMGLHVRFNSPRSHRRLRRNCEPELKVRHAR
jgi:hypothetical protein